MAFQAVPDTAQAAFKLTGNPSTNLGGSTAQYNLYVRNTISPWTQGAIDGLADRMQDFWDTELKSLHSTGWTLTQIVVTDIGASNGNQKTLEPNIAGTRAGDVLPPNVAVLVRFKGDSGGSPAQGRIFLPVGTESDVSGNGYAAGFADAVLDAMENLPNYLDAEEAQVLVSRYEGMAAPAVPIKRATRRAGDAETNTLSSTSIGPTVASQRRRRRAPY